MIIVRIDNGLALSEIKAGCTLQNRNCLPILYPNDPDKLTLLNRFGFIREIVIYC